MTGASGRRWTTVSIRRDLHRRLKARASLRGVQLGSLVDSIVETYLEGAARAEQLVEVRKQRGRVEGDKRGED